MCALFSIFPLLKHSRDLSCLPMVRLSFKESIKAFRDPAAFPSFISHCSDSLHTSILNHQYLRAPEHTVACHAVLGLLTRFSSQNPLLPPSWQPERRTDALSCRKPPANAFGSPPSQLRCVSLIPGHFAHHVTRDASESSVYVSP